MTRALDAAAKDVWAVDPVEACGGRPVGLAWFSPACTDFSSAEEAPLAEDSIGPRALARIAVRWASVVRPRIICLESVREFLDWGPLRRRHSPGCPGAVCARGCPLARRAQGGRRRAVRTHGPGRPGAACMKGCQFRRRIESRRGETFRTLVERFERLGYVVEWRILRARDCGALTTGDRLILVARRDGRPMVWPDRFDGRISFGQVLGSDSMRSLSSTRGGGKPGDPS